jgi:DNA polymerase I-like protein with 3'-5' exonuclease and polymerase domains
VTREFITLDFETYPIAQRPEYPPRPVGVALKWPGDASFYFAWGHPTANNCDLGEGRRQLRKVWDSGLPILCHHSKFDLAVATEGLGLPMVPWDRIHDTMFLAYLCDPHSRSLGLKELANDYLQWAPEERDAVAEWIGDHTAALLAAYPWNREWDKKKGDYKTPRRITPTRAGAWIFAAPGDVVGPYAVGDTDRTAALFKHLYPVVVENGMQPAYDRERQIMPILMDNEREGMRADVDGLARDTVKFGASFDKAENWLRKELRAGGLNFDADDDVSSVLLERGVVPEENWTSTDSGKLATNKDALRPEHFTGPNGPAIASALGYRNRLKTCLDMFMRPWLEQASNYGGYITTNWNQVRGAGGGTRTGRPSTNEHNFLNISKDFESKRDDGYEHPAWLEVPNLPLCRKYVLPDPGEVFLHRDFDGQEMRVFAHFEQGDLWQQFNAKPDLDPHEFIGEELMRVAQREIERTRVKTLNFQGLYGGGIPALQAKLRCSAADAKQLKAFHNKALPGRQILNEEIKRLIGRGQPIHTWGGRLYFSEPPRVVDGRMRDFLYKLINYLIQGSAADLTKEAIIAWHGAPRRGSRFLVTVYDEINISAHPEVKHYEMNLLRDAMEAARLSVPMLSSGKEGPTWGDLQKCA